MTKALIGKIQGKINNIRRKIAPGVLILMYHRIAEGNPDPWGLCVSPQHFEEHLKVIRQMATPLSLQQLNHEIKHKRPVSKAITITFDDGYADNLLQAKPLLEKYDIPATVFVASGWLDNDQEFWWDELERLLLLPGTLPQALNLEIQGQNHHWDLGELALYSEASYKFYRHWRADIQPPPTPRHSLFLSLYRLIIPLCNQEQRSILDRIQAWSGSEPLTQPHSRALTKAELLQLAAGEIVEIGAHTVMHPLLSALPLQAQRAEIEQSKRDLEAILGYQASSFAYPFGSYIPQTVPIVKCLGFDCACTCIPTTAWQFSDRFQLPRLPALNWDGGQFAKQISAWLQI